MGRRVYYRFSENTGQTTVKMTDLRRGDLFTVVDFDETDSVYENGDQVYYLINSFYTNEDGKRQIDAWKFEEFQEHWEFIKSEWKRRGMEEKSMEEVMKVNPAIYDYVIKTRFFQKT